MSSIHSSADAAVESLMVADLVRCFPDFRKQTKFRQYLNKREKILNKVEKIFEREKPSQNRAIWEVFVSNLTQETGLSPSS